MKAQWSFYRQTSTDTVRNPISGEFFSTEAVKDVAEALVREGIQNSLDARCRRGERDRTPARVRILVSGEGGGLAPAAAEAWFGTLWPHLQAPRNGLGELPDRRRPCPVLVFEDFGTIGLTGDPAAFHVADGIANHFLNFFRAEGHSDKGEHDKGSWGVGKTVFPRASRISSFIGYTVRDDDGRKLLLGRSILKYHAVGDRFFKSDGYLGEVVRGGEFVLPIEDAATIARFRRDFAITREAEPGLSIAIPWYETGPDGGLTFERVTWAVLRGFFYPILMGNLSVELCEPGRTISLHQDTVIREVRALGGEAAAQILPLVELAEWAKTRHDNEHVRLKAPDARGAQRWDGSMLEDGTIEAIRNSLAARQRIALRVPMTVHPKASAAKGTEFRMYLEPSEDDGEHPVFIRDELIITDVRPRRTPRVRSLVIVEDLPLGTLLRDAETPAHTQWNERTSHFKDKYKFGPGAIEFVRNSVSELLRILHQSERQPDPSLTIDYFSVPAPPEDEDAIEAKRRRARKVKGPKDDPPVPPIEGKKPRIRIDRLPGGFALRPGAAKLALPATIEIRAAYDVRRGHPLRKFHPADFDIGAPPISRKTQGGVRVVETSGNRITVAVESEDFSLVVDGFDPARDLYLKADLKEPADAG